eukprot:CAMPEP_0198137414 /NCGR_PEP_ID=MMETSP1443-20131203/894_1 /TAXON_ID=186043 /ORGANISM="Entomoneis sp., Strain CCMP2396" /LENGTH=370 /DNA_ID=CAMNT_0043798819 /DNA_START=73 /DNA_END=1185 /DNA_ORIENTATION=-
MSSQDIDGYELIYTERQQRILGILPVLLAPLSVAGSSLIIFAIHKERQTALKSVYHRLVLGVSCMDWLGSISLIVFGPWAVPKEAEYFVAGARGSFTTCEVSGFFLHFFFGGTFFYSTFLAVYFLLHVRFEWRERTIARYVEPIGHFAALFLPLIIGVMGKVQNALNPWDVLPGVCGYCSFPPGCETHDEIECQRGESFVGQSTNWFSVFFVFCFCVIAVCMILITLRVRLTELRIQQYAGGSTNHFERTRETGKQGLYYIGAFFVTFFPVFMIQILYDYRYQKIYFFFAILAKLTFPLQGFWNAWIYLHKRFRTLTQQDGSLAFVGRLRENGTSFLSTRSFRMKSNRGDVSDISSEPQLKEQDPQTIEC